MIKVKISHASGLEQEDSQSDCETLEQFINCRFGRSVEELKELGIEVTEIEAPKAEAPKAEQTPSTAKKDSKK